VNICRIVGFLPPLLLPQSSVLISLIGADLSVVCPPGVTHQQYLVSVWHCIALKDPSSSHSGMYTPYLWFLSFKALAL